MIFEAVGGLVLVAAASGGLIVYYGHLRWEAGYERHKQDMAERRSLRRMETRTATYSPRHQAAPWPGPDPDTIATTGELRQLAYDGNLPEITRLNAAWMRVFDLIGHARKTERAA